MPGDEANPWGAGWRGLPWTEWLNLDHLVARRGAIPREQGIYRVRCSGRHGLLYLGISVSLSSRLRRLSRAIDEPDGGHHYAGGCVAAHSAGRVVQVSFVQFAQINRRELMGLEVDLIAAYRTFTRGTSPTCQFAGERP